MATRGERGRWTKGGKSPNPGGRPKGEVAKALEGKTYAQRHALSVLKVVHQIALDEEASDSDRLKAAQMIIERAWGKPIQEVDISGQVAHAVAVIGGPAQETFEEWVERKSRHSLPAPSVGAANGAAK